MAINKKLIHFDMTKQLFMSNANGLNNLTKPTNGIVGNIPYYSVVFLKDGYIWTHGHFINGTGIADSVSSNATISWYKITDKPSTFIPSAHTQSYTTLTGSGTTANQAIVSSGTANGWTLKTLGSRAFDSTSYLPLAGGTMNAGAMIVWQDWGQWGASSPTYPKANGGLQWSGTSDWIKLFAEETAPDDLRLILQCGDDTSPQFNIRNYEGITTVSLHSNGTITGTSIVNSGSNNNYVLLGGGGTKALSDFLYKSGGTLTGNLILKGNTTDNMTYSGNVHPCIRFDNSDSSQNVSLIFTDLDSYRSPAGLKLVGNQGREWFEAPVIYQNGTKVSVEGHTHSYLPLAGGIMTGIESLSSTSAIEFKYVTSHGTRAPYYSGSNFIHGGEDTASQDGANVQIGTWYGFGIYPTVSGQTRTQGKNSFWHNARTGNTYTWGEFYSYDGSTNRKVLHEGNSSVSKSGETLTVKINGTSQSLTNTWRGIQNNLTSSSTTDSLSAYQGYLLANGSARDNTKLPLAGGTMVGTISASSDAYGGGGFHNGYANIILRGNTTTGTSGIVFSSSKGDTSINRPSDCAFIQYHPYGISTATAVGTNPTIGTSGKAGRFVIGIHNDSGDQLWLQTSAANDLKHVVGASIFTIYDSGNLPAYPTKSSWNYDDRYSFSHQPSSAAFAFNIEHNSNYVTFDGDQLAGAPNTNWFNGFVSTHNNYLSSYLINQHRTANWYVGYSESKTAPTWYKLIHSGNYTNYTVTKTGSGASGTWDINISGNASTATIATQDSDGNQINTTYVKKRQAGYSYNNLGAGYSRGTNVGYWRITIPKEDVWCMMQMTCSLIQSYSSGYHAKVIIYGYCYSGANWTAFNARVIGYNSEITVHGADRKYIYIKTNNSWETLSVDKIIFADKITNYDVSAITIDWVSSLPSTHQDATMYQDIHSGNIGSQSVNYATSAGSAGSAGSATKATQDSDGNQINTTYLKKSGGTMTGTINCVSNYYVADGRSGINMNNSDIIGCNSIRFGDLSDDYTEALMFYRSNGNWDSFRAKDGTFYFGVNNGTEYTAIHSGNYTSYCATSGHTHDGRYMRLYSGSDIAPASTQGYWSAMTTQSGITGDWWHIIHTDWGGEANWRSELALPTQGRNGVRYRSDSDGGSGWTFGSWVKLLDENNWSSYCAASGHNHDGRYIRWSNSTANTGAMGWGTLTAANGYTVLSHCSSSDGGDMGWCYKGGQIFMQLDGYYYQNEGRYRCLDTSDIGSSVAAQSHSHSYLPLSGGTMSNTNLVTNLNADLLDGLHLNRVFGTYTREQIGTSPNFDNPSIQNGLFEMRTTSETTGETGTKPFNGFAPFLTLKVENVMMQLTGSNANGWYIRGGQSGNVTMANTIWQKLARTTDNVASATKLQTSRTLWGQSFDGTGNVNGKIELTYNADEQLRISASYTSGVNGHAHAIDAINPSLSSGEAYLYQIGRASSNSNSAYFGYVYGGDSGTSYATIGLHSHNRILNVTASDMVGIGTTTPSYKLDVNGTLHASGATTLSNTLYVGNNATIEGTLGVTGTTTLKSTTTITANTYISGETYFSAVDAFRLNYGSYGVIHRNDGGSYWILLTNKDNLNGGFNNLRPFHIDFSTGTVYMDNNAIIDNLAFTQCNISMGGRVNATWGYDLNTNDYYGLYFKSKNSSSTGILFNDDGNVGINTLSPSYKLDVNGTLRVSDTITATSLAADYNDNWNDGTHAHPWYGYDHRYDNTGVYSTVISDYFGMTLKTKSGNISITNGGNVGIGTFAPLRKLHVIGEAIFGESGYVASQGTGSAYSGTLVGQGFMELSAPNPYIDFHANKSTADFTSRLIQLSNEVRLLYVSSDASYNGYILTCEGNHHNPVILGIFDLKRSGQGSTIWTLDNICGPCVFTLANNWGSDTTFDSHTYWTIPANLLRVEINGTLGANYTTKTTVKAASCIGTVMTRWINNQPVVSNRSHEHVEGCSVECLCTDKAPGTNLYYDSNSPGKYIYITGARPYGYDDGTNGLSMDQFRRTGNLSYLRVRFVVYGWLE